MSDPQGAPVRRQILLALTTVLSFGTLLVSGRAAFRFDQRCREFACIGVTAFWLAIGLCGVGLVVGLPGLLRLASPVPERRPAIGVGPIIVGAIGSGLAWFILFSMWDQW